MTKRIRHSIEASGGIQSKARRGARCSREPSLNHYTICGYELYVGVFFSLSSSQTSKCVCFVVLS